MKTRICDTRKRIFYQTTLILFFLTSLIVGKAWSDDITPIAKTRPASNISASSATLNGTVYPNNPSSNAFYVFQWGTTTSYENQTKNQSAGNSMERPEIEVSEELTNLSPNTIYHYRLVSWNSEGWGYGEDNTFTTYVTPGVTTDVVTNVTYTSATLSGTVNPNGTNTSASFYYGSESSGVNTKKQDVGSGTSSMSISASISNLQPGTIYYYRIEASNSGGTTSGPQMSFTTPSLAPIITTQNATNVSNKTATLNGIINPNGTNVTYNFRWGPKENPSAYSTNIKSAGSGNIPVKVSANISGLIPGNTYIYAIYVDYNYRISGVDNKGHTNGHSVTLTTLVPPSATTTQATNVTASTATLNGTIIPNGAPTLWHFEYGKLRFIWKKAEVSREYVISNFSASVNLLGLDPDSLYRYRIVAKSAGGTTYGPELTFKTLPFSPPSVATGQANNVTTSSAVLMGIVNPKGTQISHWFQYGPTTSYGKNSTVQTAMSGTGYVTISDKIDGLIPNTVYHYRCVASNVRGTVYGLDKTFTTSFSPQNVTTGSATGVTSFTTTFNGIINPHGLSTTWWFDYGLTASYGKQTKIYKDADTVNIHSVSLTITSGLDPNTTYHFRLGTSSSAGVICGGDKTFTTPVPKPIVTTGKATNVTSTHATITGTVNPNGSDTTYYFEYGTTSSYGNTIPTPTQLAGNGTSNVNVSTNISGKFTPKSTYHYRIVAENKTGTTYGEDKTFIVPLSTPKPGIKNISPAPALKSVTGVRP